MQIYKGLCKIFQPVKGFSCTSSIMPCANRFSGVRVKSFWSHLSYFLSISLLGFVILKNLRPKDSSNRPKDFDLFFTSVSAITLSSMTTLEMEAFSNTHLIVITVLMLVGGEVFTSMLELQLQSTKFRKLPQRPENRAAGSTCAAAELNVQEIAEVDSTAKPDFKFETAGDLSDGLRRSCIRYLGFIFLGFLLVVHVTGSLLIYLYMSVTPSARNVLRKKGIERQTFAVMTTVSSFANVGFIATKENMIVFKRNSGLLLLIIAQILMGNTLFPVCLRMVIWVLKKVLKKKVEVSHLLEKPKEMGCDHLLQPLQCLLLVATVVGFILVQLVLFCWMEWDLEAMRGMSFYEKVVGSVFQSVNARHAGETIVDISTLAPAVLVLYVIMMYLPAYTSFSPVLDDSPAYTSFSPVLDDRNGRKKLGLVQFVIFSQLAYVSICIILVCIIENKNMSQDPINFSVLNIVLEVISAYGNVGFTTGYSCERQLKLDDNCKDTWYGFVGRWSTKSKLVLIFVMFLGRLKKFNMNGGKAWILR